MCWRTPIETSTLSAPAVVNPARAAEIVYVPVRRLGISYSPALPETPAVAS